MTAVESKRRFLQAISRRSQSHPALTLAAALMQQQQQPVKVQVVHRVGGDCGCSRQPCLSTRRRRTVLTAAVDLNDYVNIHLTSCFVFTFYQILTTCSPRARSVAVPVRVLISRVAQRRCSSYPS